MNTNNAHSGPSPQMRATVNALLHPAARGGTLLLVEDSRMTSDSVRQMFRGSGGRLRRVDTLSSARRHLALYTPDVALVDLGMPDGSGLDLINEMARKRPRVPLIIAISGQPDMEDAAIEMGADRFVAKPFANIAAFRQILAPVFFNLRLDAPARTVTHDDTALRDDLYLALDLLRGDILRARWDYTLQFVEGLACCTADFDLRSAVQDARDTGNTTGLALMIRNRLRALPVI